MAQWLRVRLPMQGTRVRAPIREDPTCCGAAGPVSHGRWACVSRACALQQERPQQWEARVPHTHKKNESNKPEILRLLQRAKLWRMGKVLIVPYGLTWPHCNRHWFFLSIYCGKSEPAESRSIPPSASLSCNNWGKIGQPHCRHMDLTEKGIKTSIQVL